MRKRLRGDARVGLATPLDLCSAEDHGRHLKKEKAVAANLLSLRPMVKPVNVSDYEEDVPPLT